MPPPTQQNIYGLFHALYNTHKQQDAQAATEEDDDLSYETCDSWQLLHGLKGPGSEKRCDDAKLIAMMNEKD